MKTILIIAWMAASKTTVINQEFDTAQKCEHAKQRIIAQMKSERAFNGYYLTIVSQGCYEK